MRCGGLHDVAEPAYLRRDHTLLGLRIAHRLEDRVLIEERVAGEVLLGDEPAPEGRPEERELYVGRPPSVVVVLPRVSPGLTVAKL